MITSHRVSRLPEVSVFLHFIYICMLIFFALHLDMFELIHICMLLLKLKSQIGKWYQITMNITLSSNRFGSIMCSKGWWQNQHQVMIHVVGFCLNLNVQLSQLLCQGRSTVADGVCSQYSQSAKYTYIYLTVFCIYHIMYIRYMFFKDSIFLTQVYGDSFFPLSINTISPIKTQ